jgi:hypothetical protein
VQQFTNKKLHPIVVPVVHKQCIELKDNTQNHGQINYIDTKAKCRHLQEITCKGTLRQVLICLRPRTQYPPPYTLYTFIQYTYSHREGYRGGEVLRVEPERNVEGQQFKKLGRKYQHD